MIQWLQWEIIDGQRKNCSIWQVLKKLGKTLVFIQNGIKEIHRQFTFFSDRIEIISTGGLPVDLNKEEFYKGISKPVNSKLQKIFGQLGYVEQTGHGIPLIISNYGKQAFDIMDNFINVTIPFHHEKKNIVGENTENEVNINEAEQRVIEYLCQNSNITIKELVKISGYSDGYIRKILTSLKTKKIIERQGGNKTGKWIVVNRAFLSKME